MIHVKTIASSNIGIQQDLEHVHWLNQSYTQKMLKKLEVLRLKKLEFAAVAEGATELQLRLLLNEAKLIKEMISVIVENK